jgi:steroid delta-isomerase-like uncharacterized protein
VTATASSTLIQRYIDAWNTGDIDTFEELIAPDYVNHSPGVPDPEPGPAGLRPIVEAMRAAIPDLHYELLHIVDGGELVAFHTRVSGTQTGHLFGQAPAGRHFSVEQMQIERVRDGMIVEHWRLTDEAAMARQLAGES